MDAYLESLVKKGEEATNQAEEELVEAAEQVNDTAEISAEPTEDVNLGENGDPSVVTVEEVKEEPAPAVSVESQPAATDHEVDKTYFVENVRIYNIPDRTSPSVLFTGNIIYKGQVEEWIIVEHIKQGHGLVKGYTLSLN